MSLEVFSKRNPLYREIVKGVEFINMYNEIPIKFVLEGVYILEEKKCWTHVDTDEFWKLAEAIRVKEEVRYITLDETYLVPVMEPFEG